MPQVFSVMSGKHILDGRNCLDHDALRKAGFVVTVLGRLVLTARGAGTCRIR